MSIDNLSEDRYKTVLYKNNNKISSINQLHTSYMSQISFNIYELVKEIPKSTNLVSTKRVFRYKYNS